MRGALMLKKLLDFYDEHGQLLEQYIAQETLALAEFDDVIGAIDKYLEYNYGEMYVRTAPTTSFTTYLSAWFVLNLDNFNKLYTALLEDYDALDEYRMITHEGIVKDRADITNTATNSGSLTSTYAKRTTKDYSSTNTDLTEADAKFEGKSEQTQDGTTGDVTTDTRSTTTTNGYTANQTKSATIDTLGTISGNEVEEKLSNVHGNLGRHTPQEVLEKEIELRQNSFIVTFAQTFERDCLTGLWSYGDDDYYRW